MEGYAVALCIGIVIGIWLGIEIAPPTTVNNIDKIKGNDGVVNVKLSEPAKEKKKGFLKRLFTKKNKS